MRYLIDNAATIITSIILIVLVIFAIKKTVNNKCRGKCDGCPYMKECDKNEKDKNII